MLDAIFNFLAFLFGDVAMLTVAVLCVLSFTYAFIRFRNLLALALIPITISLVLFYFYIALEPGTGALTSRELTAWYRPSISIFFLIVAVWVNRDIFKGRK